MGKINNYPIGTTPKLTDKLIGTRVGNKPINATFNFTLASLLELFDGSVGLQKVLDVGNTATQDIFLNGNISCLTSIPNNIQDEADLLGTIGQVLGKSATGLLWLDFPEPEIQTLQKVLDAGNTATQTITLNGNISATNLSGTNTGDNATNSQYSGLATSKENTIVPGTTLEYYRGDKTFQTLDKTAIGLADVDNTSDIDKPISADTQEALNTKANISGQLFTGDISAPNLLGTNTGDQDLSPYATNADLDLKANIASPTFTGTVGGITKAMVGLSNVDNTTDLNKPISTDTQSALNLKINLTEKGAANGVVPLDSGAKILTTYLPDSILGNLKYAGTYNGFIIDASADFPELQGLDLPIVGYVGIYFITTTEFTRASITYNVGDWVLHNGGNDYVKVDNTDAVTTVFGRLGNILANEADYASFYYSINNPSNFISRNSLSFVAGSGAYNPLTGVITIPTNTNQITNGAGFISGSGTTNQLARFTASGAVGDSGILSDGTNTTFSNNATFNGSALFNANLFTDLINPNTGNLLTILNGGSNNLLIRGNTVVQGTVTASNGTLLAGTGTTNQIPKFTSSGAVGNSLMSDNGVSGARYLTGINSNDVSFGIGNSLSAQNTAFFGWRFNSGGTPYGFASTFGNTAPFVLMPDGGNVGINTTNPTEQLDVVGNGKFSGTLTVNNGSNGRINIGKSTNYLYGDSSNNIIIGNVSGDVLAINNTGNVGINQANPTERLDVVGNGKFSGTVTATNFIGSLSGNAFTATALLNPRLINGVSFNGTTNITIVDSTKEPAFLKNNAFNKNFGTVAGTVAQGNDSRINNGQTAFGWGDFRERISTSDLNTVSSAGIYRQEEPPGASFYSCTLNMNSGDGRQQLNMDREGNFLKFRGSTFGSGNIGWSSWKNVWHSGNLTNLNQLSNGPGYITGYSETDTLQTVTNRGNTTTNAIKVSNAVFEQDAISGWGDVIKVLRAGSYRWALQSIGNLPLFTDSLTVEGTVTATDFIGSSDIRLKENIKTLATTKINSDYKTFNFIDDNIKQTRTGVIAQELEVNHPEFIRTDSKGMKSVSYGDLHSAEIAYLKAKLELIINKLGI